LEYEKAAVMKYLEIPSRWAPENDNPNTTQTPECTKDECNVKIMKRKVSPKVSPTTYIGRRVKERRSKRVEEIITDKMKVNDFWSQ
jgi:hypothetical protein